MNYLIYNNKGYLVDQLHFSSLSELDNFLIANPGYRADLDEEWLSEQESINDPDIGDLDLDTNSDFLNELEDDVDPEMIL